MRVSIAEIAKRVNGEVRGDPDRLVSGIAPFNEATGQDITLASEATFLQRLEETDAGCIIVPQTYPGGTRNLILAHNPRVAFARVVAIFHPFPEPEMHLSERSMIGKDVVHGEAVFVAPFVSIGNRVRLGSRVRIHPHVYIGDDVTIGDDVEIEPNVTILGRCSIGSRVIIHAGTVIGSDGFGFAPDGSRYHKVPHVGTVVIEDDVEIGANNTIDRATFGKTWIKRGVKTDNLIQIAHNVEIGEDTVIAALTGISGSVTIGRHVILAGQVGVGDHLTVADNAVVGPQAGVAKSVAAGETLIGSPAIPIKKFLRMSVLLPGLPEMKKKLNKLEKKIRKLKPNSSEPEKR
ncbi:MAG: UDP-3-O-(3-hydroxymyristoyl)glucosamine N-acyltransferase [Deltaproteobacteria bacterium]|nr:UDP-3-O-(3-hydroxymyristoyl)glucosamine N-acyltransferase [Deltaproteobacteria bacterium]